MSPSHRKSKETQLTRNEINQVLDALDHKLDERINPVDDSMAEMFAAFDRERDLFTCVLGEEDDDVKRLTGLIEKYKEELAVQG